jgi:hypothetical protein
VRGEASFLTMKRTYSERNDGAEAQDRSDVDIFYEVQLRRLYPQTSGVLSLLDKFMTESFKGLESLSEVELEASFGLWDEKTKSFSHSIPKDFFHNICACLSVAEQYECRSKWFVVYDYDMGNKMRLRVSMENGNRKTELIQKVPLDRVDLLYSCASFPTGRGVNAVRVNAKLEVRADETDKIVEFKSVRVSVRMYYTFTSCNFPGLMWKFELIQYWTGGSVSEAEENMRSSEPVYCFECEVVNLTKDCVFSRKDRITLACSLLLKMEDFFRLPSLLKGDYTDSVGEFSVIRQEV